MSQCHGIKQFHTNFQFMCNACLHAAVMDTFPKLRSIMNIYFNIDSNNIVIFSFGSENSPSNFEFACPPSFSHSAAIAREHYRIIVCNVY